MRRATPRFLAVHLSSCLRLQRAFMRRVHPMMPGLDNHLVELHRELSCHHSRNCSWHALPIRGICWPRAGVRGGGGLALVMAVRPHVCLSSIGCQQLVFVGLAVSAFGTSAVAAGRRHHQCWLPRKGCHCWFHIPSAYSASACACLSWLHASCPHHELSPMPMAVPRTGAV